MEVAMCLSTFIKYITTISQSYASYQVRNKHYLNMQAQETHGRRTTFSSKLWFAASLACQIPKSAIYPDHLKGNLKRINLHTFTKAENLLISILHRQFGKAFGSLGFL